jgi:DNA-binding GntR family transcriptional regulator
MGMDILDSEMRDEAPAQPNYSRLRELIRADIIEGRLASGSRLKIAELAKRYESSAIPVREALHQLQGEGIVTFEPNRGARVRQIDDAFLRNIHEVRAVLEPYLIRWFVRHRSEKELEELIAAQREYDRGAETEGPEQWRHHNQRYHAICYEGHYNHEALVVAKRHNDLLQALAIRFPMSRSRVLQVCREHWQIIESIRAQDEDATAAIVAEHVRRAGQDLIERMLAASHSGLRRGHGPGRSQKDY